VRADGCEPPTSGVNPSALRLSYARIGSKQRPPPEVLPLLLSDRPGRNRCELIAKVRLAISDVWNLG
jgi:hypothetical protein